MSRSATVIEVEIDAKQKRLAYIREEDRQLVEELGELWNELNSLKKSGSNEQ